MSCRVWGNPISVAHVELGLGSPLAALGRYNTDLSLLKIMSSDLKRHLNSIFNAGSILHVLLSTVHAKCVLFYYLEVRLKTNKVCRSMLRLLYTI